LIEHLRHGSYSFIVKLKITDQLNQGRHAHTKI
jgi:hypothetical protein